jgi:hypothetical protein
MQSAALLFRYSVCAEDHGELLQNFDSGVTVNPFFFGDMLM